jgi:allantoinase
MADRKGHYLFDYSPIIHRPPLILPDGANVAFWIGVNIEHFELDKPSTSMFAGTAGLRPDPLNYGWRDYGARVGIWRLMDALDRFGLRGSALLNSDVCHWYPEIVSEARARGWCWVAHGRNNSTLQAEVEGEAERAYLEEVVTTIEQATGARPRGWLGPALSETYATPSHLADLGFSYILDWCNDDQPYPLRVDGRDMISVPYSIELNDISVFVGKSPSAEAFCQMMIDAFDVLYEEGKTSGRVLAVGLHPWIINQPFRQKYLERALEYICGHEHVWLTTSDEIAEWYFRERGMSA